MKKVFYSLAAVALLFVQVEAQGAATHQKNGQKEASYAKHEAIVLLKDGVDIAFAIKQMQKVLGKFSYQQYALINALYIKVSNKSFEEIKSALKNLQFIKSIEKNYQATPFKQSFNSFGSVKKSKSTISFYHTSSTPLKKNSDKKVLISQKKDAMGVKIIAPFAQHEAIVTFYENVDASIVLQKIKKRFKKLQSHQYSLINAAYIRVPNMSFEQIKQKLKNIPGIKSVEKNFAFKAFKSNDSYYEKLWAIENNAQTVNNTKGTKDADMDVDEAWKIETGDNDVVVAVLDTGVDYTHSDLSDNMWNGNANHGYDFAGDNDGNNDSDPMPDTPYDENGHYHGTHVAGIIGAVGNNENGISGVAQNIQIMAVKVFRPNGYGYSSDILEGLDYISKEIDRGVNIVAINASYGGKGGENGDAMDEAIKKLGQKGVVFCAAAGNDGKNIDNDPVYPASYDAPNIITVAASDQDDKLASFSNYGVKSVEVAAPGTNILSTYPNNQYAYLQGTSMATPQVTGVVALLSSAKADASVKERIDAIKTGVDKKSSLNSKVSTNGRVNAYKALKTILNKEEPKPKNHPPKANDDKATTKYETAVVIDVLKNDSDEDGDKLFIKSVTTPSHGQVTIENEKIKYEPDKGFSGEDSFYYTISDGRGKKDSAKVTIKVKEKEQKQSGGFFPGFFGSWF